MPNYAGSSLYESEEEYDVDELAKEFEGCIRKESVQIYREKLNTSEEIEKYDKLKLEKINSIILKLKSRYSELSKLKNRYSKLKKESKSVPTNEVLKDMVFIEKEKYDEEMGKLIDEVDEILGTIDLDKTLSGTKISSCVDHISLLKILKQYRKELIDQVDDQKEIRKKTIAILLTNIENEFDLGTGTEFMDFLKEDIKKYNKDIQRELKKYSVDKLREVLLNLKLLTTVYGYDSNKITSDFISEEMKLIKAKLKKDKKIYDNKSQYLDEISKILVSEMKAILIEEVKGNLEKNMKQLENKKEELESKLKKDRNMKEILDIKNEQMKLKKELKVLKILKSNSKNKEDFSKDLDNQIKENLKKSILLNKRLNELKDSPKEVLCDLGSIFGIINLGVKSDNKNKSVKKMNYFLDDGLDDLLDDDLTEEDIVKLEDTDLESVLKHYSMHTRGSTKNNEELSFEELYTQFKYYKMKIMDKDIEKEESEDKLSLECNLNKKNKLEEEELEDLSSKEIRSELELDYNTDELLDDDELVEQEISDIPKECVESELELDYNTDELLDDDQLDLKEELSVEYEEVGSGDWVDYKTDEELEDEDLDYDKEKKVSTVNTKSDDQQEKYIFMSEDEKKDIYVKLSDVSSKLRHLKWRVERLDKALKDIKSKTKRYDKLIEEHENKKDIILDEIAKYELFKDLSKSIDKGKNTSYQLLYT